MEFSKIQWKGSDGVRKWLNRSRKVGGVEARGGEKKLSALSDLEKEAEEMEAA